MSEDKKVSQDKAELDDQELENVSGGKIEPPPPKATSINQLRGGGVNVVSSDAKPLGTNQSD